MEYTKPLPLVNDLNRPHWEGAKKHQFLVQKCRRCGHTWFPPLPNCSRCLEADIDWVAASGKGIIHSFIVYQQGWLEGYKEDIPYNVALIELEEGVRLINNAVGVDADGLRVEMPVEVVFEDISEDVTIPKFRPADKECPEPRIR